MTFTADETVFDRPTPPGFHRDDITAHIGHGDADFQSAIHGLATWAAHPTRWTRVLPRSATVAVGQTIIFAFGPTWAAIAAPCRVASVQADADHYGFAYATLEGHPETGIERFDVRRNAEGDVTFCISAISSAHTWWARCGGPLTRWIQIAITKDYVKQLERYVRRHGGSTTGNR